MGKRRYLMGWRWILVGMTLACLILGFPEKTEAAAAMRATSLDAFLIPAPVARVLKVIEVWKFTNPSDASQGVEIRVPTDAQQVALSVGSGDAKHEVPISGTLTMPNAIAAHQSGSVTVTYSVPMSGSARQLVVYTPYSIDEAHLYTPEGDTALTAEGLLTQTQVIEISGTKYREFTRLGVPAGTDWPMNIQVLPTATTGQTPSVPNLPILGQASGEGGNTLQALANLVLAAFVLAVGLIGLRTPQRKSGRHQDETPVSALYGAWARLERQHEQGMVDDATYVSRRNELKTKLIQMESKT